MIKNHTNTIKDLWSNWREGMVPNNNLISSSTQLVSGFEYPRTVWTALICIRAVYWSGKVQLYNVSTIGE